MKSPDVVFLEVSSIIVVVPLDVFLDEAAVVVLGPRCTSE